MVELIGRARQRLDAALAATFAEERQRFDALAQAPEELDALATDLRSAAVELRELPAVVPMDALTMFGRPGDVSGAAEAASDPGADATAPTSR